MLDSCSCPLPAAGLLLLILPQAAGLARPAVNELACTHALYLTPAFVSVPFSHTA